MKLLNNPITALLGLLAFAWLAYYSLHHDTPARPVTLIMQGTTGYSVADRGAMHSLLAKVKKEKRLSKENAVKMVYLYGGNRHD